MLFARIAGLVLLLILQSCVTVPPDSEIVRASSVLVLPGESIHRELGEHSAELQHGLAKAVRARGFQVHLLEGEQFRQLQAEALTVSGAVYDPAVGRLVPLNRPAYTKALIDLARSRIDYDVLLQPEWVLRTAQTQGDEAVWDGVEREYTWFNKPDKPYSLPKKISALSLRLGVYTDKGRGILVNYSGISLPYDLDYVSGKFSFRLKENLFTEKELQQGIKQALKAFNRQVSYDEK